MMFVGFSSISHTKYEMYLRNGVRGYFMAGVPQILHVSVICVLMTDIKSAFYRTTIRIFSVIRENFYKVKRVRKIYQKFFFKSFEYKSLLIPELT